MSLTRSASSVRFFLLFRDYASCQTLSSAALRRSCRTPSHSQSESRAIRHFSSQPARKSQKESLRPQNHYEMFPSTLPSGPPPKGPFAIDVRQLRKEFLQLQAKAHPDLHSGSNKARAEGLSSLINEAYKTLQDPLRRAQYLLLLRGIDVAEDETMKIEDPELLMDVLDMRETIESVEEEEELEPLKAANDEKVEHSVRALEGAFRSDDIERAKEEAVRLRYWINIKESLHAWERGKPVVLVH